VTAVVHVHPAEATEVAQKLLAAAEELGFPVNSVQTSSDGWFGLSFLVPDEVHALAMGVKPEPEPEAEPEAVEETPAKRKPGRPKKAVASEPEPEE
jgi:hypothetical protein